MGGIMADVVVTVPVCSGEEDRLFGRFLDRFVEACALDASRLDADAPYVMVRSDPYLGGAVKMVIFQETRAADEFSQGWTEALQFGLAS